MITSLKNEDKFIVDSYAIEEIENEGWGERVKFTKWSRLTEIFTTYIDNMAELYNGTVFQDDLQLFVQKLINYHESLMLTHEEADIIDAISGTLSGNNNLQVNKLKDSSKHKFTLVYKVLDEEYLKENNESLYTCLKTFFKLLLKYKDEFLSNTPSKYPFEFHGQLYDHIETYNSNNSFVSLSVTCLKLTSYYVFKFDNFDEIKKTMASLIEKFSIEYLLARDKQILTSPYNEVLNIVLSDLKEISKIASMLFYSFKENLPNLLYFVLSDKDFVKSLFSKLNSNTQEKNTQDFEYSRYNDLLKKVCVLAVQFSFENSFYKIIELLLTNKIYSKTIVDTISKFILKEYVKKYNDCDGTILNDQFFHDVKLAHTTVANKMLFEYNKKLLIQYYNTEEVLTKKYGIVEDIVKMVCIINGESECVCFPEFANWKSKSYKEKYECLVEYILESKLFIRKKNDILYKILRVIIEEDKFSNKELQEMFYKLDVPFLTIKEDIRQLMLLKAKCVSKFFEISFYKHLFEFEPAQIMDVVFFMLSKKQSGKLVNLIKAFTKKVNDKIRGRKNDPFNQPIVNFFSCFVLFLLEVDVKDQLLNKRIIKELCNYFEAINKLNLKEKKDIDLYNNNLNSEKELNMFENEDVKKIENTIIERLQNFDEFLKKNCVISSKEDAEDKNINIGNVDEKKCSGKDGQQNLKENLYKNFNLISDVLFKFLQVIPNHAQEENFENNKKLNKSLFLTYLIKNKDLMSEKFRHADLQLIYKLFLPAKVCEDLQINVEKEFNSKKCYLEDPNSFYFETKSKVVSEKFQNIGFKKKKKKKKNKGKNKAKVAGKDFKHKTNKDLTQSPKDVDETFNLTEENENLHKKVLELEQNVKNYDKKESDFKDEIKNFKEKNRKINSLNARLMEELKKNKEIMQEKNEEFKNKEKNINKKNLHLQTIITEKDKQINEQTKEIQSLKEKLAQKNVTVKTQKNCLTDKKNSLLKLEDDLKIKEEQNKSLHLEIVKLKELVDKYITDNKILKESMNKESKVNEKLILDLKNQEEIKINDQELKKTNILEEKIKNKLLKCKKVDKDIQTEIVNESNSKKEEDYLAMMNKITTIEKIMEENFKNKSRKEEEHLPNQFSNNIENFVDLQYSTHNNVVQPSANYSPPLSYYQYSHNEYLNQGGGQQHYNFYPEQDTYQPVYNNYQHTNKQGYNGSQPNYNFYQEQENFQSNYNNHKKDNRAEYNGSQPNYNFYQEQENFQSNYNNHKRDNRAEYNGSQPNYNFYQEQENFQSNYNNHKKDNRSGYNGSQPNYNFYQGQENFQSNYNDHKKDNRSGYNGSQPNYNFYQGQENFQSNYNNHKKDNRSGYNGTYREYNRRKKHNFNFGQHSKNESATKTLPFNIKIKKRETLSQNPSKINKEKGKKF